MIVERVGRSLCGLAVLFLANQSSHAQAVTQGVMQPRLVAAQIDTNIDLIVEREIARASGRGLPTEPLRAKVREGRLKRAPDARIRVAVLALVSRLDTARAALGPSASAGELIAGADALSAGADAAAVRAVVAASTARGASVPLGALAQLVASGVPSTRAVSMILDLIRRRATATQVIAFGNAVERDAAGGLPASEAAQFRWGEFGSSSATGTSRGNDAAAAGPLVTNLGGAATPPPNRPPRRRP
ncbi:MAG: hypothetical protein LH467_04810 [Gemmatimonadaceae bacterium]|nr:hypothetical protein [Gemmatimonadaceae bacterium]